MALSRFEREDNNLSLLPENGSNDYISLAQDADLEHLARVTKGEFARSQKGEIIVWNRDLSLKKEVANQHYDGKFMYFQSRGHREEITDYGIVIGENSAAIIYPLNPLSNTVGGLEISERDINMISGNESKFPKSYVEARNQSFQARVESEKTKHH